MKAAARQYRLLGVLKAHQQIIAYWQIAALVAARYGLDATAGAVRGALERLYQRGFLIRARASAGSLKGNRYAFSAEPCPHSLERELKNTDTPPPPESPDIENTSCI